MNKLCVVFIASIALLAGSVGHLAAAQDTTGRIAGRVVDAQGLVLPGASITVTGPQGDKTAVTDNEGRFTVPFLIPGTTAFRAELQGFAGVNRRVQVRLADVELPLTLQVGVIAAVKLVSSTPGIIRQYHHRGHVDSALLHLSVGAFQRHAYLTLVIGRGAGNVANPSVGGSSGLENQYVVDGVNITNGGYGALGSYSIVSDRPATARRMTSCRKSR
jgi:hypothetical protein